MNPLEAVFSGGQGGLSLQDQQTVTFDPFADLRKTSTLYQTVTGGGYGGGNSMLAMMVPLAIVAVVALIAWRLLK